MSKYNINDMLMIGVDITGEDESVLNVARIDKGTTTIIQTFIGKEAEDMYEKLTGWRGEKNEVKKEHPLKTILITTNGKEQRLDYFRFLTDRLSSLGLMNVLPLNYISVNGYDIRIIHDRYINYAGLRSTYHYVFSGEADIYFSSKGSTRLTTLDQIVDIVTKGAINDD